VWEFGDLDDSLDGLVARHWAYP